MMGKAWIIITLIGISIGCNRVNQSEDNETGVTKDTISKVDTAQWTGTYEGTVPAQKSIGMSMKLTLNPSNTYELKIVHLEDDPKNNLETNLRGEIQWEDDSTTIVLNELDSISNKFKIRPGKIEYLNPDATPNTGDLSEFYILRKK